MALAAGVKTKVVVPPPPIVALVVGDVPVTYAVEPPGTTTPAVVLPDGEGGTLAEYVNSDQPATVGSTGSDMVDRDDVDVQGVRERDTKLVVLGVVDSGNKSGLESDMNTV